MDNKIYNDKTSSKVLDHMTKDPFSIVIAYNMDKELSKDTPPRVDFSIKIREMGYVNFLLIATWEEDAKIYQAPFYFASKMSEDDAMDFMNAPFICSKGSTDLRVIEFDKNGMRVKDISSAYPITEPDLVKGIFNLISHIRSKEEVKLIKLEEYTRVPFHCAHGLAIPYSRCYTFTNH